MILALFVVLLFVAAWLFKCMWNFAVVAALSVANPIGFWHSIVLMLFIALFCVASNSKGGE